MPLGYLAAVLIVAWGTCCSVAPRRRPRWLARLSFRSGLVLNELPFVGLAWLATATALAAVQGDLDTPVGAIGAGIAALSAIGLVVVARRGLAARAVLDQALDDALGPGWRATLDPAIGAGLRRRRPWARVLLGPVLVRRRDVERIADVPYGDGGRDHLLDVLRPRTGTTGAPVFVYFHGGAFRSGHKDREGRPLTYRLASRGWVCISANYRLEPRAAFPDHHVDAKRVVAWARAHAAEHGGDPATVLVAGSSAGGHLAVMTALTAGDPAFQPGFEGADTSVAAAIGLYGYYGPLHDGARSAPSPPSRPIAHLRPDAPPCLIVHGDRDSLVAVESARELAGALRAVSRRPVAYAELPGAQHAFDLFHSLRNEAVVDAVEAFATWVRSPTPDR